MGLFLQVWTSYDKNYYDPFFHGVDWTAMREKYRPLAEECQTKAEIYDLINDMIRELRSSHVHLTPAPAKKTEKPRDREEEEEEERERRGERERD